MNESSDGLHANKAGAEALFDHLTAYFSEEDLKYLAQSPFAEMDLSGEGIWSKELITNCGDPCYDIIDSNSVPIAEVFEAHKLYGQRIAYIIEQAPNTLKKLAQKEQELNIYKTALTKIAEHLNGAFEMRLEAEKALMSPQASDPPFAELS
jgi:hypothetical protein